MKTSRRILVAAIAFFSLSAIPCRAEQDVLEPVEFQQIQLGGFWKLQVKRLTVGSCAFCVCLCPCEPERSVSAMCI